MRRRSTSLRSTILITALSLLVVPSASFAWNGDTEPDEVVTMTVDLPATDGSGGGGTCNGYASINTSAGTVAATLNQVVPAVAEPTPAQRIAYFGWSLDDTYYWSDNGNPVYSAIFTDNQDGTFSLASTWSAEANNSFVKSQLDTNGDGLISNSDASPLMMDRRVFSSAPFDISFDASTCIDSDAYGAVWVERTPVELRVQSDYGASWQNAEFDPSSQNNALLDVSSSPDVNANAYLLRSVRVLDGLVNVPLQVAQCDDCFSPPILAGDEGATTVRGVMQMYGDRTEGQYRVKYGFWLELDSDEYFFEEFPFFFFPFGPVG